MTEEVGGSGAGERVVVLKGLNGRLESRASDLHGGAGGGLTQGCIVRGEASHQRGQGGLAEGDEDVSGGPAEVPVAEAVGDGFSAGGVFKATQDLKDGCSLLWVSQAKLLAEGAGRLRAEARERACGGLDHLARGGDEMSDQRRDRCFAEVDD